MGWDAYGCHGETREEADHWVQADDAELGEALAALDAECARLSGAAHEFADGLWLSGRGHKRMLERATGERCQEDVEGFVFWPPAEVREVHERANWSLDPVDPADPKYLQQQDVALYTASRLFLRFCAEHNLCIEFTYPTAGVAIR